MKEKMKSDKLFLRAGLFSVKGHDITETHLIEKSIYVCLHCDQILPEHQGKYSLRK